MSDEEKKEDAPETTQDEKPVEEKTHEAPAEKSSEAPAAKTEDAPADKTPEASEKKPAEAASEEPKAEDSTEEGAEETKEEKAPVGKAYLTKLDNLDELKPGMTIKIHEKIKDTNPKGEERERVQIFEGIILGLRGGGDSRTMTVRKVSKGFGVEKIYPINSPVIDKIELVKQAKVRKAKLGYLKNLKRRFKKKLKETHFKK